MRMTETSHLGEAAPEIGFGTGATAAATLLDIRVETSPQLLQLWALAVGTEQQATSHSICQAAARQPHHATQTMN